MILLIPLDGRRREGYFIYFCVTAGRNEVGPGPEPRYTAIPASATLKSEGFKTTRMDRCNPKQAEELGDIFSLIGTHKVYEDDLYLSPDME